MDIKHNNKVKFPHCRMDDAGLLVGFITIPMGPGKEALLSEISNHFNTYKKEINKYFHKNKNYKTLDEFTNYFYDPRFYLTWGEFDSVVLSLIDDFEFATHTFRPFDPMFSNKLNIFLNKFSHQVVTGPTPKFRPNEGLVKLARQAFLDNRLPLIGISKLKLNVKGALIGGTDFMRVVLKGMKVCFSSFLKQNNLPKDDFKLILLESHSWHEITAITFGKSFKQIVNILFKFRDMSILELSKNFANKYEEETITVQSLFKNVTDDFHSKKKSYPKLPEKLDAREAVFEKSLTTIGFDYGIFSEVKENKAQKTLYDSIYSDDKIFVTRTWSAARGSITKLASLIKSENVTDGTDLTFVGCVGRGDVLDSDSYNCCLTKDFLKDLVQKETQHGIKEGQVRCHSTIGASVSVKSDIIKDHENSELLAMMEDSAYELDKIKKVNKELKKQWIPRNVSMRVLNMFTNYNLGILDPLTYASFLELKPLVNEVYERLLLKRGSFKNLDELTLFLTHCTDMFETAWHNRFFSSYILSDLHDYNLNYKGGIQQLVTSLNGAFKVLSKSMDSSVIPILCVSGKPGVCSTSAGVELDFLHIFQPESFAGIMAHEAANHLYKLPPEISHIMSRTKESSTLINEALSNLAFADEDSAYQCLITPQFFDYIFSDVIAYYLVYAGDSALFSFWYCNMFVRMNISYTKANKTDEVLLTQFLMRILAVLRLCDREAFSKFKMLDEVSLITSDIVSQLQHFLDYSFSNSNLFKAWFKNVNEFCRNLLINKWRNIVGRNINNKSDGKSDKKEPSIKDVCSYIRAQCKSMCKEIESGIVPRFDEMNKDYLPFNHIQALFYSYLNILKLKCNNYSTLLRRNASGNPDPNENSAPFLSDPRGGTFTKDPDSRRNYYKYRCVFVMSLWNLAMRMKKHEVNKTK